MVTVKKQRGGKREGAGRKPRYDKPYQGIYVKLPPFLLDWLKANTDNRNGFIVEAIQEKIERGSGDG